MQKKRYAHVGIGGRARMYYQAIAKDFNECCLLFGLPGQTAESMTNDIETGLEWFERVCVNIMI